MQRLSLERSAAACGKQAKEMNKTRESEIRAAL